MKETTERKLLKIGLPVTMGLLVTQIQQITDQAFLGHASADYLTAVGNAGYTIWGTLSFIFALGTGTMILISQNLGSGNKDRAEEIIGSTLAFSSLFSILLFALWFLSNRQIFVLMGLSGPVLEYTVQYTGIYSFGVLISGITSASNAIFTGTGKTRTIMVSSILRAAINAALDWVLIFGHLGFPTLGIAGAAIATVTADIVGGAFVFVSAFSKRLPVRFSARVIAKAKFSTYLSVIRVGIPAGLEEFAWNIGNILLISYLNRIDGHAAGIYTIVMSITLIPSLLFMGMGSATTTLTGHQTGANTPEHIGPTVRKALGLCLALSAVALVVFCLFPRFFAGLFTTDRSVIVQTTVLIIIGSLALFPKAANIIFGGGIRGMGDTKWMLKTQIFGTIFVLVTAKFMAFSLSLTIVGIFIAIFLDELVRAFMNGSKFYSKIRPAVVKLEED